MSWPVAGQLPICKEWICWYQSLLSWARAGPSESTEGHPFPFGRMPSLTPSRSRSCILCIASCPWQRAGPGSPVLPPPAESAAAASWTCLQETTARLGSCSWTCPCSAPSFGAPACLMPCACTGKVGPSLSTSLLWSCLSYGAHGAKRVLFPSCLQPLLVFPVQSVPFSFSFHPADASLPPLPSIFHSSSSPCPPCPTCPVPRAVPCTLLSPSLLCLGQLRSGCSRSHLPSGGTYFQEQAGGWASPT